VKRKAEAEKVRGIDGQPAFGVATAILGGAAMIASLMVRQQEQRKKLISQIAIMLR
jgi:hypothetical protein